jgi:hypothetical protein
MGPAEPPANGHNGKKASWLGRLKQVFAGANA